ncbi:MAG TPA: 3D domain-containing protein [Dictyoglomaceae bacterium]|nr:3D domain-containing protein [Dictyoglomaceae bacterium]HOL39133.1 3D domain-containing protein [Dictyoglomaceae bacterium]HOP94258.1 3D domain-containing protein [Dictyoglomaceae bacterium]HPP15287.1 3D domain-containing protein [Dictyoglomaceae bacterium]HPU42693.1 3D domain-containing protein [Dictyoglomaceae bacterium]
MKKIISIAIFFGSLVVITTAKIEASLWRNSIHLRPIREIVIVDGNKKPMKIKTNAGFVWEVLEDQKIKLSKYDIISPPARTPLTERIKEIKITRVTEKNTTNTKIVEPKMILKVTAGETYKEEVIQKGQPGKYLETYRIREVNGKLEKKTLVSSKELQKMKPKIINITSPVLKHLNLKSAVFEAVKPIQVTATAYEPWTGGDGNNITALGWIAKKGIIAVDPRYIPLRSAIYVPNYGFSIAGDTGGLIKGWRIDLCYPTVKEVIEFGRRKIQIYLLKRIA